MNRSFLILAAAPLLVAQPARADWGQTHWGDPIETVMSAIGSGIEAKPGDSDDRVFDQDQAAEQKGEFHGIPVRYQFYVDVRTRGLSLVRATPLFEAQDCAAFAAAARAELGKPGHQSSKDVYGTRFDRTEWTDKKANLAILLSEFSGSLFADGSCLMTWQPYGSGKPGLKN